MTDIKHIVELVEIDRAISNKLDQLNDAMKGDCQLLGDEQQRISDLILDLTGASDRCRNYRDQYIAMGAANVSWCPLEDPLEVLLDESRTAEEIVKWLLDYAAGKIYGETIEKIDAEENAELIPEYGLLTA